MKKLLFLIFLPVFLFAKYQVVTFFPLETHIVKKIAKQEAQIIEITHRYTEKFHELSPSEIAKLSKSRLYFHFGMKVEQSYADILEKNNPKLLVVDLSKNIEKIGNNPYIWTDPFILKKVAKNIYDTVVLIDKKNEIFYKKNYNTFLDEIDETFFKIMQNFNKSDINSLYAIDDYWDYFAKRFRLELIKKERKTFSTLELKKIVEKDQDNSANKILFRDNEDYKIAFTLAANLNIKVVENDIFNEDWQENLFNLTTGILR